MKIKFSYIVCIFILLFLYKPVVYADQTTLDVFPSYFKNIDVHKGEKIEFYINLKNSSKLSSLGIHTNNSTGSIKAKLTSMDKPDSKAVNGIVAVKDWLTFEQDTLSVDVNETSKVKCILSVPQETVEGEHIAIIDIRQMPAPSDNESMGATINISTSLQIPVIFNVLPDSTDASEVKESGNLKLEYSSNVVKINSIKGALALLFSGIHQPDIYEIKYGNTLYWLCNLVSERKVPLGKVTTDNEKKMSSTKYVYVPPEIDKNIGINRIEFNEKGLKLKYDDKVFDILIDSSEIVDDVKKQITSFSTSMTKKPTLQWLLDTIVVSESLAQSKIVFKTEGQVVNTGTKTLIPEGVTEVYDRNNIKLDTVNFSYSIIPPKETKPIQSQVNLSTAKYNTRSFLIKSAVVLGQNIEPYETQCRVNIINTASFFYMKTAALFLTVALAAVIIFRKRKR